MGTKKQEIFNKLNTLKNHFAGLHVLAHALEEESNIHFEIGRDFGGVKGTEMCFASKSINAVINKFVECDLSEEKGFFIDVWEDENPVASIPIEVCKGDGTPPRWTDKGKTAKVMFEINKKIAVGTRDERGTPEIAYEYETVFRSVSAIDCRTEWTRKQYNDKEYVMDIRESPEGKESYHVADIKIDSMVKQTPRQYGKDWLVALIKNYTVGDAGKMAGRPEEMADRILDVYGRGKA